jgi:purine-cytosine permease-like protein
MVIGTIYIVFFAHNFLPQFEGFLITVGVLIAAWCGVFLGDMALRRKDYSDTDLFRNSGRYGDVRLIPVLTTIVTSVIGWGLVTNTGASWLTWQGYLLGPICTSVARAETGPTRTSASSPPGVEFPRTVALDERFRFVEQENADSDAATIS